MINLDIIKKVVPVALIGGTTVAVTVAVSYALGYKKGRYNEINHICNTVKSEGEIIFTYDTNENKNVSIFMDLVHKDDSGKFRPLL